MAVRIIAHVRSAKEIAFTNRRERASVPSINLHNYPKKWGYMIPDPIKTFRPTITLDKKTEKEEIKEKVYVNYMYVEGHKHILGIHKTEESAKKARRTVQDAANYGKACFIAVYITEYEVIP